MEKMNDKQQSPLFESHDTVPNSFVNTIEEEMALLQTKIHDLEKKNLALLIKSSQAEKYVRTQNENLEELNERLQACQNQIALKQNESARLKKSSQILENEIERLQDQIERDNQTHLEMKKKIEKQAFEFVNDNYLYEVEAQTLNNKIALLEAEQEKLKADLKTKEMAPQLTEKKLVALEAMLLQIVYDKNTITAELRQKEDDIKEMASTGAIEKATHEAQRRQLQEHLIALQSQLSESKLREETIRAEKVEIEASLRQQRQEFTVADQKQRDEATVLATQLRQMQDRMHTLTEEQKFSAEENAKAITALTTKLQTTQVELQEKQSAFEAAISEIEALNEQHSKMSQEYQREVQSQNEMIENLQKDFRSTQSQHIAEMAMMESESADRAQQIAILKAEATRLHRQLTDQTSDKDELNAEVVAARQSMAQIQSLKIDLEIQFNRTWDELQNLTQVHSAQMAQHEQEKTQWAARIQKGHIFLRGLRMRYLSVTNELKAEIEKTLFEKTDLEKEIAGLQQQTAEARTEIATHRQANAELHESLSSRETRVSDLTKQIATLENHLQTKLSAQLNLEAEKEMLILQMAAVEAEMQNEMQRALVKEQELAGTIEQLTQETRFLQGRLDDAQAENFELMRTETTLRHVIAEAEQTLRSTIAESEANFRSLTASHQAEIEDQKRQAAEAELTLNTAIDQLNQETRFMQTRLTDVQNENFRLLQAEATLQRELAENENSIRALGESLTTQKTEIETLYSGLETLNTEKDNLEMALMKDAEIIQSLKTSLKRKENESEALLQIQNDMADQISVLNEKLTHKAEMLKQSENTKMALGHKVKQYVDFIENERISIRKTLNELQTETQIATTLHPLKDFLKATENEFNRLEQELRKMPASALNRAKMEDKLDQLLNQKRQLGDLIAQSEKHVAHLQLKIRNLETKAFAMDIPLPDLTGA